MTLTVRPLPAVIAPATLARLARVETATVGHFRLDGFMSTRLGPVLPGRRVAGTAVTVRTVGIDSAPILVALDALRPGDVLVIDRSGEDRHACFGAVTAADALAAGCAGVIIDGRACDFPDIRAAGLPLWCAGPSPILGRRLDLGGAVNVPIACGGVAVAPGDAILADDSGILVLPPTALDAVIDEALARQEREAVLLARIGGGERLATIIGGPRFDDLVQNGDHREIDDPRRSAPQRTPRP